MLGIAGVGKVPWDKMFSDFVVSHLSVQNILKLGIVIPNKNVRKPMNRGDRSFDANKILHKSVLSYYNRLFLNLQNNSKKLKEKNRTVKFLLSSGSSLQIHLHRVNSKSLHFT